jgi:RND family efflux transporter MFP subunit
MRLRTIQTADRSPSGEGGCPLLSASFVFLIGVFLSLALPAAILAGPPPGPPPTVMVSAVTETDIVPATDYVGHVEAIQMVDLRARIEGFLEAVRFKEGDFVHAGDVLYVIEQDAYKAQVDAAGAKVQAARAELYRAGALLKRLRAALPESVPATDLDNAVAAEQTARAQLTEAEAAATLARLNLDYTTIKAPISGRIGRTRYTRGNLVNPASGVLARIVRMDPIRVVYAISETDLPAIQRALADADRTGKRILAPRLRLVDGGVFPGTGRVSFVDNQVDPTTGTIAVRAEFANPKGVLIPDQYVTVLVKASSAQLKPIVPQAAVLIGKEGRSVLVVEKGVAVPRPITIGPAIGTNWVVESGLKSGDAVIVSGIQKVRPGMAVNAVPAGAMGGGKP